MCGRNIFMLYYHKYSREKKLVPMVGLTKNLA